MDKKGIKTSETLPSVCTFCDQKFESENILKEHVHSVHDGLKPHKCEDCGKSFGNISILERHLHVVHDGYKDYKCEFCDKSFTAHCCF